MKVFKPEDLQKQGISILTVQKSRSLNYLNREYIRKSDLPKKFLSKALEICETITKAGKKSFIVETNYTYTIWEEKNPIFTDTGQNLTSNIPIKSASSLSYDDYASQLKNDLTQSQMTVFVRNIQQSNDDNNDLQQNISNDDSTAVSNTNASPVTTKYRGIEVTQNINDDAKVVGDRESLEVTRYRGVEVIKNTGNSQSANDRKTTEERRTYRGIVY